MDEDGSNPLHDAGVEALWGVVRAQEQKLDRLEPIITNLARLTSNTNKDCEKEEFAWRLTSRQAKPQTYSLIWWDSILWWEILEEKIY